MKDVFLHYTLSLLSYVFETPLSVFAKRGFSIKTFRIPFLLAYEEVSSLVHLLSSLFQTY